MSLGLSGAIIGTIVVIAFMIIVVGVIPYSYNTNLKQSNGHAEYCNMIKQKIDTAKDTDVQIAYIHTYSQDCSYK